MNLDNTNDWQHVVVYVARLGVLHASMGEKALSSKKLMGHVISYFKVTMSRNGHPALLKRAYGAGYNGIILARRAAARSNPLHPPL